MARRDVKSLPPSKRQYVRTFPASLSAREIPGAKPAPFLGFIEPQLATLRPKPPAGDNWLHEIKYDGYRLQAHVREGRMQLFTRRGYDWTDRFESVALAAWELKTYGAIIDGEVIVPMARGQSDFHALERDLGSGVRTGSSTAPSSSVPYGLDLRDAALLDRKQSLPNCYFR